jgi:hypothetical protein
MAMNIAGFQSHPIPPIARSSNLLDSTRCSAQDGDDTHPDPTPQEILDSPGGKQFFTSSREGGVRSPDDSGGAVRKRIFCSGIPAFQGLKKMM